MNKAEQAKDLYRVSHEVTKNIVCDRSRVTTAPDTSLNGTEGSNRCFRPIKHCRFSTICVCAGAPDPSLGPTPVAHHVFSNVVTIVTARTAGLAGLADADRFANADRRATQQPGTKCTRRVGGVPPSSSARVIYEVSSRFRGSL